ARSLSEIGRYGKGFLWLKLELNGHRLPHGCLVWTEVCGFAFNSSRLWTRGRQWHHGSRPRRWNSSRAFSRRTTSRMSLNRLLSVSRPIREPLALNLAQRLDRALMVVYAIGRAVRVSEVELL